MFKRKQITITLEKYAFVPGETIKGTMRLHLKKPVYAEQLTVSLVGRNRLRHKALLSAPPPVIYEFTIPVDEKSTYFNEVYPFKIKIPADILTSIQVTLPYNSTNTPTGSQVIIGGNTQGMQRMKIIPGSSNSSPPDIPAIMQKFHFPVDVSMSQAGSVTVIRVSKIDWCVEARLDVALNIDIRGNQKIVIS